MTSIPSETGKRLPLGTWLRMYVRLFAVQGAWNYETMLGNGIAFCTEPALRLLPGRNLSNSADIVATSSASWTPQIGGGYSALFYVDTRMTSDYNTGSDLFIEKEQDGYVLVNGRIGIRGPDQRWAV